MTLDWPAFGMMNFLPLLFVLLGIGAGFNAFRTWRSKLNQRQLPPDTIFHSTSPDLEPVSTWDAGLYTAAALVFTVVGVFLSIAIPSGTYQFRSLPIDKLLAIEVYSADKESRIDRSKFVWLENTNGLATNGLLLLRKCTDFYRNHESFSGGYVIKLIFEDSTLNDYYVSAFRETSAGKDKGIVLAHREPIRNLNLGEFDCPEFQAWVRTHIDPHFKTK